MDNKEMLGIIGVGRLGEILVNLLITNSKNVICGVRSYERLTYLKNTYQQKGTRVSFTLSNVEVAEKANVLILSVKPGQMKNVCDEIAEKINAEKTVISVAAAVPLNKLCQWVPRTNKIIRCMPNIVTNRETPLIYYTDVPHGFELMKHIFYPTPVRPVEDDNQLDAVTLISGCAPALFSWYYKCLAQSTSLPEDLVRTLLTTTMTGTAKKIRDGSNPDDIIQAVSSPGGITEMILNSFEENKIDNTIHNTFINAVTKIETLKSKLQ